MDPEVDPALCLSPEDLIPEEVQILDYPVFIHVLRVEDQDEWTDRSTGGGDSSSDDSNDVNMDPGSGPSRRKPRSRSFACRRGVVDDDSLQGPWPSSSRGGGPSLLGAVWVRRRVRRRPSLPERGSLFRFRRGPR